MSNDPAELAALPAIILLCFGIGAAIWVGGTGGDVTWIDDMIGAFIVPALILGTVIAGASAIREA